MTNASMLPAPVVIAGSATALAAAGAPQLKRHKPIIDLTSARFGIFCIVIKVMSDSVQTKSYKQMTPHCQELERFQRRGYKPEHCHAADMGMS